MIFKAYLKQAGEGCDYTIGCAQKIISVEASNMLEAVLKVSNEIAENYSNIENRLESCDIFEVNDTHSIDLKKIYADVDNSKPDCNSEFEEYQRLKAKYGA